MPKNKRSKVTKHLYIGTSAFGLPKTKCGMIIGADDAATTVNDLADADCLSCHRSSNRVEWDKKLREAKKGK